MYIFQGNDSPDSISVKVKGSDKSNSQWKLLWSVECRELLTFMKGKRK